MRSLPKRLSVWMSCLAFAIAFTLFPSFVAARGKPDKSKGKGAVKTQLKMRKGTESPGEAGKGKPAGFVILNTTADQTMHIRLHLHKGASNQNYNVWVKFFPEDVNGKAGHLMRKFGDLSTNQDGKGNAQYERSLPGQADPDDDHDIEAQIVIKKAGVISTSRGMASAAESVPLKK